MTITKKTAGRLMIQKQLLNIKNPPTKSGVYKTIEHLGCIQIDTLSVIERAHYLTLWARHSNYDKQYLDELAYKDRLLFEYNAHAASFIPFKDYRFYIHAMNDRKKEIKARFQKRSKADPELINKVLEKIKQEGPVRSKDFEGPKRDSGWWNWKPAKLALELLFRAGVLLIDRRENFQRVYDLSENIIPPNIETSEPSEYERQKFFTLKTLNALGLTKAQEVRKYYHNYSVKLNMTTAQVKKLLEGLKSEGVVQKYNVENEKRPYYCLIDDMEYLESPDKIKLHEDVNFLVYFDNFLWNRERIMELFGFESKLEIYVPKEKRVYGYYHLPILYKDKLVARIEPKIERSSNTLIIRSLWHEKEFQPDEEYENKFDERLHEFAQFHNAENIIWDETQPKVMKEL